MRTKAHMVAKAPVPKIADIPILRFVVICNFQTIKIGTTSIATSENVLNTADDIYSEVISKHFPGISGFQILRRGRQAKMLMKNAAA